MKRLARFVVLSIGVFLATGTAADADHPTLTVGGNTAGPVVTKAATTLEQGYWSVSLLGEYQDLNDISDTTLVAAGEAHEDVHSVDSLWQGELSISYGLTDDVSLGLSLPYLTRTDIREPLHIHGAEDEVANLGSSNGLGDLTVHGTYRFFGRGASPFQAALILGLNVPTGKTGARARESGHDEGHHHEDNKFEAEHQPGSGSWDPFAGLAVSRFFDGIGVHASAIYTLATRGTQQTDLGDSFHYNLALVYRLGTAEGEIHHHEDGSVHHHEPKGVVWDLMLELNGEWRERLAIAGMKEENSGGHLVFLSPGIRAIFPSGWSASLSIGVPVVKDLNGLQSEPDFRVLAGVSKAF